MTEASAQKGELEKQIAETMGFEDGKFSPSLRKIFEEMWSEFPSLRELVGLRGLLSILAEEGKSKMRNKEDILHYIPIIDREIDTRKKWSGR